MIDMASGSKWVRGGIVAFHSCEWPAFVIASPALSLVCNASFQSSAARYKMRISCYGRVFHSESTRRLEEALCFRSIIVLPNEAA